MDDSRLVLQRQGKPKYRLLTMFHFAFKICAYLIYMFEPWGFTSTFVMVLLLLSLDFWLVKNLTGRLLAGLRWWNVAEVGQEGENKMVWKFEAWSSEERQIADSTQVI